MKAKAKQSFGTLEIDHFSPPLDDSVPKAINVVIGFEDALKLHLGLMQLLGKLNGYNRATRDGKAGAVNLCVFTAKKRMSITEDRVSLAMKRPSKEPTKRRN
jgi:hypothetical protein